jgi:hypothetical protein
MESTYENREDADNIKIPRSTPGKGKLSQANSSEKAKRMKLLDDSDSGDEAGDVSVEASQESDDGDESDEESSEDEDENMVYWRVNAERDLIEYDESRDIKAILGGGRKVCM